MNNTYPSCKILLNLFFSRILIDEVWSTLINTILSISASLYCLTFDKTTVTVKWWIPVIVIIVLIILYNIMSMIQRRKNKSEYKYANMIDKCYFEHCTINNNCATKIYRLNNIIHKHLEKNIPIDKIVFDKIADFNTVAFDICNSLYHIISDFSGNDSKCQVTVFRRIETNSVKMVAFSNEYNRSPSTYKHKYMISSNNKKYFFIRIFEDSDIRNHYCINREEVKANFKTIKESKTREEEICQYIGIPLKTDRESADLLLQIDVSKNNVFGENLEEVKKLTQKIIMPYVALLHKAYERDIIFTEYYDMIVDNLASKAFERVDNL